MQRKLMQKLLKLNSNLGIFVSELLLMAFVFVQIDFTNPSLINVLSKGIFTIWVVLAGIKYTLILNDRINKKEVR